MYWTARSWLPDLSAILIVVAHVPAGRWIERCLRGEGYIAVHVTNCADAIRVLMLVRIDLVILWPGGLCVESNDDLDAFMRADPIYQRTPRLLLLPSWSRIHERFIDGFRSGIDRSIAIPVAAVELLPEVRRLLLESTLGKMTSRPSRYRTSARRRRPGKRHGQRVLYSAG